MVLCLYASTVKPCREALQALQTLRERFRGRGLQVLAVSREGFDEQRRYAKRFGFDLPLARGEEEVLARWAGVRMVPTTIVVDREGVVRLSTAGVRTPEALSAAVEPLLPGK